MIIAVDYDGTLKNAEGLNLGLISRLKKAQMCGNTVILWTCRDGQRLKEAVNDLRKVGFIPNYVNDNSPEAIKMLGYNPRKVFADVYVDDKATR